MEKALSFFRAFDLAFFAPGGLVFWILHVRGYLGPFDPLDAGDELTSVDGLFSALATIVVIYMFGVLVHAFREGVVDRLLPVKVLPSDGSSWYQTLTGAEKDQLKTYFWYMRATCFNMSVALFLVAGLLAVSGDAGSWIAVACLLASALPLRYLGQRYHRAMERLRQPA